MKINTTYLTQLLGSPEAAQKFVELFRQQLPEQLADLRAAHAASDRDGLSVIAHGLKSQCRYLGLDEAGDLLQRIEDNPQHPGAGRWLEDLFLMLNDK